MLNDLKAALRGVARRWGYSVERIIPPGSRLLDVFDLAVRLAAPKMERKFVLQIGANDGLSWDPLRKYLLHYRWPAVLVEPNPAVFARLIENYRGCDWLRFENSAISGQDGTAPLYLADIEGRDTSGQASFDRAQIRREFGSAIAIREVPISTLTVETLLARHGIDSIGILQIDTEGYDYEVLKLFRLEQRKPLIVHFEHCHLPPKVRQECFEFLCREGYALSHTAMDTVAVSDALLTDLNGSGPNCPTMPTK